ncbi:ABC-type sugar transport system, periplasmic component, contains N-terminal xre family HTH domain [Flexilinea flocculi]|uniref:ABC-type sugar transport system, periplasmic component, contains N-terminal xre family HTH domain n=2 Tax=Flexilinea flocculi TaxID=1678840 RepID=A0A0S7BW00_9CHLR|nr:substrate-binding domain-containing protein [Flexilinea flocculi]GAP40744.1 ABC-type sugar transport system, periplasmic component, contains N-terminal xre family HTH domain [Flexilinea flocculi]
MKKLLVVVSVLLILVSLSAFVAPAVAADTPYIAMISKGFQHKFWQTVQAGAQAAAEKYGVKITFDGPPSESDISVQVDMLNAAMANNPAALCLAALDTESVTEQLNTCKEKGIPVIGFDSGVPNAPEGSIISTASTDNEAAGALAADQMAGIEKVMAAITGATKDAPIVLSVISQDATSASITGRTTGFVNRMYEICNEKQPGLVAVTGHDKWKKASESGDVAIEILVSIAASTSVTDCQTAAQAVIQRGPVGIFCTNSGSVDGMLSATADGSDLDREKGRYKDLVVIGFDSGATLLNAVRNQWFHGAVTQDPYMIGFYAVELAVKTLNGEKVDPIVDTGCQYYTYQNMDDPAIAALLYE